MVVRRVCYSGVEADPLGRARIGMWSRCDLDAGLHAQRMHSCLRIGHMCKGVCELTLVAAVVNAAMVSMVAVVAILVCDGTSAHIWDRGTSINMQGRRGQKPKCGSTRRIEATIGVRGATAWPPEDDLPRPPAAGPKFG